MFLASGSIRLETLFREFLPANQVIDYLNIDTEGQDVTILASNDWNKYRPEMVTVEEHGFNFARLNESRCYNFMTTRGYELYSHCVVTSFYRRTQ